MKVVSFEFRNIKSFRSHAHFDAKKDFNLLVGPNGGGKSNALDALTILLRRHFSRSIRVDQQEQHGVKTKKVLTHELFTPLSSFLEPHHSLKEQEQYASLTLEVTQTDIDSIDSVISKAEAIKTECKNFQSTPSLNLEHLINVRKGALNPGTVIRYEFGPNLENLKSKDPADAGDAFRDYLRNLEFLLFISGKISGLTLTSNFLFFGPDRSSHGVNLEANLSSTDSVFSLCASRAVR